MPRRPPQLDPEHNPVHRFAAQLREIHRAAGKPTRVRLARQMSCSAATVTHILNGDRFPNWDHVVSFAAACDAPAEPLRTAWIQIDAERENTYQPSHYRPLELHSPILPIYLLCDVSSSLAAQVPAVNEALREFAYTLGNSPPLAEIVRVCVIGFESTAYVVTPLSDYADLSRMQPLVAGGGCAYGPALSLLREQIARDVAAFKAAGTRMWRPVVFFITDGEPTDRGWEEAHAALIDATWRPHPHILAFGLGYASAQTIRRIATLGAYRAHHAASAVAALREFITSMLSSFAAGVPDAPAAAGLSTTVFESNEIDLIS